jgi:nucleotide sugar dehydrogenase
MDNKKKITVIGVGRLGICWALVLERAGYDVLGVDVNEEYVKSINNKSLTSSEPRVEEMLRVSKNFSATTNMSDGLDFSDFTFVVLPTPSTGDGKYDHSKIDELIPALLNKSGYTRHLVICSTTMPGYCDTLASELERVRCFVSYNPEFIAQGAIIRDQLEPDMVLIGEANPECGEALKCVYRKVCSNYPTIHRMSRLSAEIAKLSLNCFITTKIAYANMVGDVANAAGAETDKILSCIGADKRVGEKCLKYGYGFGGPCFPRDNRAFAVCASEYGIDAIVSKSTDESNRLHLSYQVKHFFENNLDLTEIVFDSVTYKKESVIIEESQQLAFAVELAKKGIKVTINEREEVVSQVKKKYGDIFIYKTRD